MHGYGEALQALAFLNYVDGGSVGYLIASRCLVEASVRMVTMCVIVCVSNTQGGMLSR